MDPSTIRQFADGLRQLVWIAAPDGSREYFNQAWTHFTGLTLEQSLKDGWQLALHPADLEIVLKRFQEHASAGLPYAVTYRFRSAHDEYRVFTGAMFPLRSDAGVLTKWIGMCDESDAIARADDRFQMLANALPLLVWTTDRDDRMTFVNRSWHEYTGLGAGSTIDERNALVHPDDLGRLMHALRSGANEVEFRFKRRRDGAYRSHLLRWERVRLADDAPFYRVGTAIDVHDRRVAQTERERQLHVIAEAVPDVVWSADAQGRLDYANGAMVRYLGVRREETYGQSWIRYVHPDDRDETIRRWECSLAIGDPFECKCRLRRFDDSYRWFIARAAALRDASGQVTRWFGTASDIDEQIRIYEREHRVSETLQAASLPKSLPVVPWLRLDAVYAPGSSEAQIGGDWYDAFRLPDGRIVFSIGDVAGSGLYAAVTMSNMRQVIRGTAQVHADPILMLNAADRALRLEEPDRFVTAIVAVLSPVTGIMSYASAGHVPAIVRRRDGSTSELFFSDLPLGLRERHFFDTADIVLRDGDSVVFYTDGLTEAGRDLIRGTNDLLEAVRDDAFAHAERCAQYLERRLLPNGAHDDVAIMAVTMGSDEIRAAGLKRWHFDALDAEGLGRVRREFRSALAERGVRNERVEFAELVLGELAGNVVRHAPGPVEIVVDFSNPRPVLHVIDEGPGFSRAPMLPSDLMSESGRGLYIVAQTTLEFSVTRRKPRGSHARAVLL